MLSEQLKRTIKEQAEDYAVHFKHGGDYRIYGYIDGATPYAEKWQEEKERAERYEKALKAIGNGCQYPQYTANKALTPNIQPTKPSPLKQLQMTQLTDKVFAVEVPDKVNDFKSFVECVKNDEADTDVGKFKFLFATKTAKEEQARKVVEKEELFINAISQGILYCNYHCKHDVCEWYKWAADSLNSLLRSKGLDPNNNYALIEKDGV